MYPLKRGVCHHDDKLMDRYDLIYTKGKEAYEASQSGKIGARPKKEDSGPPKHSYEAVQEQLKKERKEEGAHLSTRKKASQHDLGKQPTKNGLPPSGAQKEKSTKK